MRRMAFHLPFRTAWSRPKQPYLVPGKGQFRKRLPRSAQLPLSDNDFSGSQQPTTNIESDVGAHVCSAAMGKLQSTEPPDEILRARFPMKPATIRPSRRLTGG
jgi:hypothetical protein